MNASAAVRLSSAVGLFLLLVVLNEARAMSNNGSSIYATCLQQFYIGHSETQSVSAKTSIKTSSVASHISSNEDEQQTVYKASESPPGHQEKQNWFPDMTYERNRLPFATTQNKYERQSNSFRILSYARLYSTSKFRSRLDNRLTDLKKKSRSQFPSSFERRVADLKKTSRDVVRDGLERSDAIRDSTSKGRSRIDNRITQFKRKSRNQVRDGSDRYDSRSDSRSEGRSSLHRRTADIKREFRFQGRDDFGRPEFRKESRSEGRSSLDRRTSDLKRDSRNIVRNGFERSYSRRNSRSEGRSILDRRMANLKKGSQNQVRDGFDLRNESKNEGRSSLDRKMADFKRGSRNRVGDGLERSALWSKFGYKGRSSLDRRMTDLKNIKFQVRDGFGRPDSMRKSRSEGRSRLDGRMADLKRDSRIQVRDRFERPDSMRKSRSEGRSRLDERMADLKRDSRNQVRDRFERSDSRRKSRGEGRSRLDGRMADLKRDSRNQVRDRFERSDSRGKSRSEGRSRLDGRMDVLNKESRNQVRDVAERSDSRREVRHDGRRRFEKTATDLIRKLKRGFTRNLRNTIRSNLISKVADSSRHRGQLLNRTEWIAFGSSKSCLDELSVCASQILLPRIGKTFRWRANGNSLPNRLTNGGAGNKMDRSSTRRAEDTESQRKITVGSVKRSISLHGSERRTSKSKGLTRRIHYLRRQSSKNFKDSEAAMSANESGIIFTAIPLKFPPIHNSDVQDMSLEYLQNPTNHRSERCLQAIDKHLSNCSAGISVPSFNDYRLEGWFRKESDAYGYPLLAVSLLSIGGAPHLVASARIMVAS